MTILQSFAIFNGRLYYIMIFGDISIKRKLFIHSAEIVHIIVPQLPSFGFADSRSEIRSRGDRDIDNQQILQAEEKEVVSSVATVLSDLCGPGEWMPMAKLHTEVCYGKS